MVVYTCRFVRKVLIFVITGTFSKSQPGIGRKTLPSGAMALYQALSIGRLRSYLRRRLGVRDMLLL